MENLAGKGVAGTGRDGLNRYDDVFRGNGDMVHLIPFRQYGNLYFSSIKEENIFIFYNPSPIKIF